MYFNGGFAQLPRGVQRPYVKPLQGPARSMWFFYFIEAEMYAIYHQVAQLKLLSTLRTGSVGPFLFFVLLEGRSHQTWYLQIERRIHIRNQCKLCDKMRFNIKWRNWSFSRDVNEENEHLRRKFEKSNFSGIVTRHPIRKVKQTSLWTMLIVAVCRHQHRCQNLSGPEKIKKIGVG